MGRGLKSYNIFAYAVLLIFFLAVIIFGLGGYYAGLGSDPYGIVHFANHLARGKIYSDFPVYDWFKTEWQPGEAHFVLHGNYVISEGKLTCKYTIGFPLFLAALINVFGTGSVYYANVFILLILLWLHFRLARIIFSRYSNGLFLAVLCPVMLVVVISQLWGLALRPSRDLSALMFILGGSYLGIMAFRRLPRLNYLYLIAGAFCLGFSASIRLPNVLVGIPAIGYLVARMAGKVKFSKFIIVLIVAILFFSLALGPALIQNYLSTGNPLKPPRPEIVERNPIKVEGEISPPPLWLGFFKTTAPDTAAYFWRLYGPLFSVLILIGLFSEWRRTEIKFLVLGIPLVFVLFYSMWVHLMIRYMLIAQPFLILLAVGGIGRLVRGKKSFLWSLVFLLLVGIDIWFRWRWRHRFGMEDLNIFVFIFSIAVWIAATWNWKKLTEKIRLGGLCLIILLLFLAKYGPAWASADRLFQLPEARRFGEDIDRVVEKGSIIFATKPAANYLSLFSGSYSIRPFEINRVGVDQVIGLNRLLDRGVGLYLIDSSGWKRDATKALAGFREYYDVIPVGSFRPGDYFLEENFGKPVCTIYRIQRWLKKEVELEIPVPDVAGDYLLMVNVGRLWGKKSGLKGGGEREGVRLAFNNHTLDYRLQNNINFIKIPAAYLVRPVSKLKIASDMPLPSRIDFLLQPATEGYRLDLAEQLKFPDQNAPDGFSESRLRDGDLVRLGWNTSGQVVIPTVIIPDTLLSVEIKVNNDRNFPEPVGLKARLNDRGIFETALPRGLGWQKIEIPLPEQEIYSSESKLELTAFPTGGHQLTAGEERTGALLFEEIAVVRKMKSFHFPTPREGYYFLGFSFQPNRLIDDCPKDYRIIINGKTIREGVSPGVQRLILSPAEVSPPESILRVVSTVPECDGLIDPALVFLPLGEEVTIDIGASTDLMFIEDGFFDREVHMKRVPVRWTGKTSRLFVPLPSVKEGECYLRLKVVEPGPRRKKGPTVMEVKLDGRVLGTVELEPGEKIYSFMIPQDITGGKEAFYLAELSFNVPDWTPSRYMGTVDNRRLGVMLDWIKLGCE